MAIIDQQLTAPPAAKSQAAFAAARLMSAFRVSDYLAVDAFAEALTSNLALYPFMVIDRVTHPVLGLASTAVHPPAIAEVRAACDAEAKRVRDLFHRARYLAEQAEKRQAAAKALDAPAPAEPRAVPEKVAALLAELGGAVDAKVRPSHGGAMPPGSLQPSQDGHEAVPLVSDPEKMKRLLAALPNRSG